MNKFYISIFFISSLLTNVQAKAQMVEDMDLVNFTNDLKFKTFNYFWDVVDSSTWQTDDRYPTKNFTSIAATGFAIPAYIIGVHNSFITREEAAERVLNTLQWLWNSPQGSSRIGMTGFNGFYYHFLNYGDGTRFKNVELSTIDTALLMAGILTSQSYFDRNNRIENNIRALSDSLYLRVQWDWAMNDADIMSMGWHPETGFIEHSWKGYNEAMILLVLAMGSPTHPISKDSWLYWTESYEWETFYGQEFVNFGPLFGHQYSHMFIDFKGIQDEYMRNKGIDYFENSRRATLANRQYCIVNPNNFIGYGNNIWGLSASDGPANLTKTVNGQNIQFRTYHARGVASNYLEDDGTITPTAAGGSIPFTPKESLDALFYMKSKFGEKIYSTYGFLDAFNLSFEPEGWFNPDYIGIDQGPILIQLENFDSGLIWETLKKNKYIVRGLEKAGFKGAWLDEHTLKN